MNRRWGAARIAWAMAEESADAFLPKDLAAEPVSPAGESAGHQPGMMRSGFFTAASWPRRCRVYFAPLPLP